MTGISSDALMKSLSDTAKAAASVFGLMRPGSGELVFHMRESRPSPQMQAGLDELVEAGALTRETINEVGGARYSPVLNLSDFTKWLGKNTSRPGVSFPISEPVPTDITSTPES